MIKDKKLKYLASVDGVDFYRYKTSFWNYFFVPMAPYEKLFSRKVRETLDFLRGNYHVIYMAYNQELIGYGVVTRGGGRNRFCTPKDIVLCSLWIQPEYRGKGYGSKLISFLTTNLNVEFENAYEYIRHDNVASIKSAEKNGFVKIGNASKKSGGIRSISMDESGALGIYKK